MSSSQNRSMREREERENGLRRMDDEIGGAGEFGYGKNNPQFGKKYEAKVAQGDPNSLQNSIMRDMHPLANPMQHESLR